MNRFIEKYYQGGGCPPFRVQKSRYGDRRLPQSPFQALKLPLQHAAGNALAIAVQND
jgi:hypothetical protein